MAIRMTVSGKRPMAKVYKIGLFRKEVRETFNPAVIELMLERSTSLGEGNVDELGRFYGSVMISIDLSQLNAYVNDACDIETSQRMARYLMDDATAMSKIRWQAVCELERRSNLSLQGMAADVRIRAEGACIFADVDIEGQVFNTAQKVNFA